MARPAASPLESGRVVGAYRILGMHGEGGQATVYRVRHETLRTTHALKVLKSPGRGVRERLVREGRLQAALRHPNVLSVSDVLDVDGHPGLVMEFVGGPALDRMIKRRRLSVPEIDTLATGVLRGVRAAHRAGLVHRDLKPANVLVDELDGEWVPKVADFGLAKALAAEPSGDQGLTRSGMMMGTPAYMAPEQVRDSKNVDHRADVFSLGAILYELVSGKRAFHRSDLYETLKAVAEGRWQPIQELVPDVEPRMRLAIERALAVHPDDRIPDVETLLGVWSGARTWSPAWVEGVDARVPLTSGGTSDTPGPITLAPMSESGLPTTRPDPRAGAALQTLSLDDDSLDIGASTRVAPAVAAEAGASVTEVATEVVDGAAHEPTMDPVTEVAAGPALVAEKPLPPPAQTMAPPQDTLLDEYPRRPVQQSAVGLVFVALLVGGALVGIGGVLGAAVSMSGPTEEVGRLEVDGASGAAGPSVSAGDRVVRREPVMPAAQPKHEPTQPVAGGTPDVKEVGTPEVKEVRAPSVGRAEPGEPEPSVTESAPPEDPPAEAAAVPTESEVRLVGDAPSAVWLLRDGTRYEVGKLAPGAYVVMARFGSMEPAPAGRVQVGAGSRLELRCDAFLKRCTSSSP